MAGSDVMENRIQNLKVRNGQLIPAQAEVWITVEPARLTPATEVRGRLMGPRCPYASTVEVAYPLRPPPPNSVPPGTPGLTMRVVIPEASLWEPESPFLYEGPIELWQDGQRCDRVTLSHGLRSVTLGESGLRVNGRPLSLRGRMAADCSDDQALAFHRSGYNLLVVPVRADTAAVWGRADRLGFFVLGRVRDDSEQTVRLLELLSRHSSSLGWLLDEGTHLSSHALPQAGLVGLLGESPPRPMPFSVVHFLLGPPELANLGKRVLVMGEGTATTADSSRILGSVV
jgi:hypothetical protein